MSATLSSIRFVTVLAESGTYAVFLAADSLKTSMQISVHAVKINFFPIVNGLLTVLAMRETPTTILLVHSLTKLSFSNRFLAA